MVLGGCISRSEARRTIDWRVLIAIASAFGIAAAIRNSGLAEVRVRVYWFSGNWTKGHSEISNFGAVD